MDKNLIAQYRYFLRDNIRKEIDFSQTDQNRGIDIPPVEKPYRADAVRIDLVKPGAWKNLAGIDLVTAIGRRESRRSYTKEPLALEEISFLLWATQGVRGMVPTAGCRHAFETYLVVLNGKGLDLGVYRYLPFTHQLLFEFSEDHLARKLVDAVYRQPYPGNAPATFIWTAIPYRMEWRYHLAAHKVIAIDVGHVCQNLCLACEAIGAGACAIAVYDQEALDRLLRIDGKDEFAIYLSPVGKVRDLN